MEAADAGTFASSVAREQSSCPPWCVADHDGREAFAYPQTHHSATTRISPVRSGFGQSIAAEVLYNDDDLWQIGQVVFLTASVEGSSERSWPHLFLSPQNANAVADIIAVLAGATPGQHRDLAEGIRRCAALISGEDEASGPA